MYSKEESGDVGRGFLENLYFKGLIHFRFLLGGRLLSVDFENERKVQISDGKTSEVSLEHFFILCVFSTEDFKVKEGCFLLRKAYLAFSLEMVLFKGEKKISFYLLDFIIIV